MYVYVGFYFIHRLCSDLLHTNCIVQHVLNCFGIFYIFFFHFTFSVFLSFTLLRLLLLKHFSPLRFSFGHLDLLKYYWVLFNSQWRQTNFMFVLYIHCSSIRLLFLTIRYAHWVISFNIENTICCVLSIHKRIIYRSEKTEFKRHFYQFC